MIYALQNGGTAIQKCCCKTLLDSRKDFANQHLIESAEAPGTHPEPTVGYHFALCLAYKHTWNDSDQVHMTPSSVASSILQC